VILEPGMPISLPYALKMPARNKEQIMNNENQSDRNVKFLLSLDSWATFGVYRVIVLSQSVLAM
jgi:hypothetical protein